MMKLLTQYGGTSSSVLSSRYQTVTMNGNKIWAKTIPSKIRKNRIIQIFGLDIKLEDESQGIMFAPYIAISSTYVAAMDCSHTNGIEPDGTQLYIRKKSEI